MQVVNLSALPTSTLRWLRAPGSPMLTVACKITFRLTPGDAQLAPRQDPLFEEDTHVEGHPSRSLRAASDMSPQKPLPEFFVVGSAYAPNGKPARSVVAWVAVGEVEKSVAVFCDRVVSAEGAVVEGGPFLRLPLVYERAAGGPGTWNPAGMKEQRDAYGRVMLPNLVSPDNTPKNLAAFEPIGLGPLAPSWPTRRKKLGPHAPPSPASLHEAPLPAGFDPEFWNAAPEDQRLVELRDDERIILENLHPEVPRLSTRLPRVRPAVFFDGPAGPTRIPMIADTLAIDTDRLVLSVVFRGQIAVQETRVGRIVVAKEEGAQKLSWVDVMGPPSSSTVALPPISIPAPPQQSGTAVFSADEVAAAARALPFQSAPPNPKAPAPMIAAPPPAPAVPAVAPQSPPPAPAPPPLVRPAPATEAPSPWATRGAAPAPSRQVPMVAPAPLVKPAPAPAPVATPPREILQLLWFDDNAPARLRRKPAFRSVLDALEEEPMDGDIDDTTLAGAMVDPDERRDVVEVLARGTAVSATGARAAFSAAARENHAFVPPLVLCAGEIEMPFDELESLRAAVLAAAPQVTPADKDLKAAVDAAREFLAWPGLTSAPPSVTLAHRERIREALGREKKSLPGGFLEQETTQVLLRGRHYQKRAVMGEENLRFLLRTRGEEGTLVGYLPAKLAKDLPMFQRFSARLLAEVRLGEDQYETSKLALRALALARVEALADDD